MVFKSHVTTRCHIIYVIFHKKPRKTYETSTFPCKLLARSKIPRFGPTRNPRNSKIFIFGPLSTYVRPKPSPYLCAGWVLYYTMTEVADKSHSLGLWGVSCINKDVYVDTKEIFFYVIPQIWVFVNRPFSNCVALYEKCV
jgi:hypothetical protein